MGIKIRDADRKIACQRAVSKITSRSFGNFQWISAIWVVIFDLDTNFRSRWRSAMTADEVLRQLKPLGHESIKKVLLKHGAKEPFLGVKIEDLKKLQKKIKVNHQLALDLYETGISDAMYLAGLIADDVRMTKKDLQRWADQAQRIHGPLGHGGQQTWP
jgi:3-methyladenine DNA glycosylase AlkD